MRTLLLAVLFTLTASPAFGQSTRPAEARPNVAIVIHGGAGTIRRDEMSAEREAEYRAALETALRAGEKVLIDGGSAVEAVEATIVTMEDSPLFNAGKGAVLTADGKAELDASLMVSGDNEVGATSGAVASVTNVKNPIMAARAVLEKSPHVLLVSGGAELFAVEVGLEIVDNDYFLTERREEQQEKNESGLRPGQKHGTVGCVALDANGIIAAGTSTGGLSGKQYGRVGDSPIVGAGTWADRRVGVSCTGQGETFINLGIAHDLAARVKYANASGGEAAKAVIDAVGEAGALGGLVGLDADGQPFDAFNTDGMYRGWITPDGELTIKIYGDE